MQTFKLAAFFKLFIMSGMTVIVTSCGSTATNNSESVEHTTTATPATEKPAEQKWTEVYTIKGSGSKKSAPFALNGGKARAKYKCEAGLFSFYVVPEGEDVMVTGGVPEIMTQEKEDSESYLTKDAGNYYLNVNAAGKWEIVIEEMR